MHHKCSQQDRPYICSNFYQNKEFISHIWNILEIVGSKLEPLGAYTIIIVWSKFLAYKSVLVKVASIRAEHIVLTSMLIEIEYFPNWALLAWSSFEIKNMVLFFANSTGFKIISSKWRIKWTGFNEGVINCCIFNFLCYPSFILCRSKVTVHPIGNIQIVII